MSGFSFVLILLLLTLCAVGLVKPRLKARLGFNRTRRGSTLLFVGTPALVSLILVAALVPAKPSASSLQQSSAPNHSAVSLFGQSLPNSMTGQSSGHTLRTSADTSAGASRYGSTATAVAVRTSTSSGSTKPGSVNAAVKNGLIAVVVTRNVDGDTIHVRMPNRREETIRMLLIDTPETVDPNDPVEPFGREASNFAKKKLPVGKKVYIEEGVHGHERDKYGRLLAYVYITPTDMYNEDVVKCGLARVAYVYPPNTKHLNELLRDENYAKSHHLGIWSIPGYVKPWGFDVKATRSVVSHHTSSPHPSNSTGSTLRIVASHLYVYPGDYASVTVQTRPGSRGTIRVVYKSGPSKAKGLVPKTADPSGRITWTWKVGTHTTRGDWPVTITVGSHVIHTTLHVR
jgi:micrococcal nuclease